MKNAQFMVALLLAFLLGLSVAVPNAVGLGSPAVMMGSNPVFSFAGSNYTGSSGFTQTLATAPNDMDMRITDVQISSSIDSNGGNVSLTTSGGASIGRWSVPRDAPIVASMKSGLIVPAGESLIISGARNNSSITIYYTISGQYVNP